MDNINIAVSRDKLSVDNIYDWIVDPQCGGNCMFIGTVRDQNKNEEVEYLDFETYAPMAIKEMKKIALHCIEKMDAKKVAIHHREGHVGITDIAVIIAVSSVHRDVAFKACQYAIDELKKTVPIWKKEHLTNGSYWVGARP